MKILLIQGCPLTFRIPNERISKGQVEVFKGHESFVY